MIILLYSIHLFPFLISNWSFLSSIRPFFYPITIHLYRFSSSIQWSHLFSLPCLLLDIPYKSGSSHTHSILGVIMIRLVVESFVAILGVLHLYRPPSPNPSTNEKKKKSTGQSMETPTSKHQLVEDWTISYPYLLYSSSICIFFCRRREEIRGCLYEQEEVFTRKKW